MRSNHGFGEDLRNAHTLLRLIIQKDKELVETNKKRA